MKVLFVSSGNKNGISPITKNQGLSIYNNGIQIDYFTIKGKGIYGYLKNIKALKGIIKTNNFDIIHAHYSLSAFFASLAGAKPLVVSLMGSDVKSKGFFKFFIGFFNKFFWSKIIVKSEDMKQALSIKDVEVVPNGVNFNKFKALDQKECKKKLGWDTSILHVLFAANPNRKEKNYSLAKAAFDLIKNPKVEIKVLDNVSNEEMPIYHNAADVVLLTSLWEGSPNVIKEAMACNSSIVSTDVGDVKWLFGKMPGHFLTSFDTEDVSDKIRLALAFAENQEQTYGSQRIIELDLDSTTIANRIIEIYMQVIKKHTHQKI